MNKPNFNNILGLLDWSWEGIGSRSHDNVRRWLLREKNLTTDVVLAVTISYITPNKILSILFRVSLIELKLKTFRTTAWRQCCRKRFVNVVRATFLFLQKVIYNSMTSLGHADRVGVRKRQFQSLQLFTRGWNKTSRVFVHSKDL